MQETVESIQVKLADGVFYSGDAASIIRGMIEVKVKFHEDKIRMREQRIKELQRMQSKIHDWLKAHGEQTNLELTLSVG